MSLDTNPEQKQVRHLLVIEEEGRKPIPLEASSYFIGRDPSNSIVLSSKDISRQHALLMRMTNPDPNDYSFLLIDGNLKGKSSANGTKVNGETCKSSRLRHGDCILFGTYVQAKYLILPPLSQQEFLEYCHGLDSDGLFTEAQNKRETIVTNQDVQTNDEAASLIRLASFPEIIPSPMLEIDLKGELTYLNPAALKTFPELPIRGVEHPILQGLLGLVEQTGQKILSREIEVGTQFFEQSIHYIAENGLIRCCLFDITERKHAESELHKRDRLMQSVAAATTHLLANVGYETAITKALATFGTTAGVDRICIYENHHLPDTEELATSIRFEWLNRSIESVRTQPHRLNQPYSRPHLKRWYAVLAGGETIQALVSALPQAEQAILDQDRICSVLVAPIIVNNDFWGFIELDNCTNTYHWSGQEEPILSALAASISAALQRQDKDEIIKHQAFHDALTGLPNRVLFTERLNQALANAKRTQQGVVVMFMDLDRFKTINDTLGHSVGDELLQEVANRLNSCLRESDTVARWGGDEFTILLPHLSHVDDATYTAQRILDAFKAVIHIDNHELYISTSIGISFYPADGAEAEILLQNADVALYQSKERGRGIYQLYNPMMNSRAPELLVLQNSLRHALDRGEFLLYYQPQFNLQSGAIIGVEALLRWQHPEQGLVSPDTFIPIAEETGLILDIGEWVLRTACQQAADWHQAGLTHLSVGVNLSARQFYQPHLVDAIARILEQTQLNSRHLELEITETTAIKNIKFTQETLCQLQNMGIRIAMDDFGTGYSSLNYLTQLPLNTLKIDRSFIKNLKANAKEVKIINAIISLGQGLDLNVVAEGVDSQEQLDLLQTLNCEFVQGHLTSHPLSAEEITFKLQANLLHPKPMQPQAHSSLISVDPVTQVTPNVVQVGH